MTVIALFIGGLFVGSFLNVLIYRLPRSLPFVWGRSFCPHCHQELRWFDLIPVVSYLLLLGRCRYCKRHISLQYPAIELISGVLFVLAPSFAWLVALEIFLVLAMIDLRHLMIPDGLLLAMGVVAIAMGNVFTYNHLASALGGAGFFFLLWAVSKGKWIGFGDVKLAGVLGLLFGFPGVLVTIYVGILLGGAVSLVLLITQKAHMKTAIPLGSFLALSAILYIFFQQVIILLMREYLVL